MDASPRNSMRLLMPEAQAQLHSHLLADPAGGSPHRSDPVAPASHHGHKSIEREGGCVGMLLWMRGGRRDGSAEGVDTRGGRSPGQALCSRGIRMAAVGFFGAGWDCGR
jgi:hypothetical protein